MERKNKQGDDLEDKAFRIFQRTVSCKFQIITSTWLIQELRKYADDYKTAMLFTFLKRKTILIPINDNDIAYAKSLSEHYQDPLHAVLAEKGNAEFIITRDLKGFHNCRHLVKTCLPEQI
ncbi:hypothetical protein HYY69_01450 [Candidatus Woesearchaeota archaeon]|nr:hypothetical protein [Candidatus Woesearchaeota archaeon]